MSGTADPSPTPIPGGEAQRHSTHIRRLFTSITGRYDLVNRIISMGQDQSWRRAAVHLCQLPSGGRLLDVGMGTGDVTLQALDQMPDARVVGIDVTAEMLQRAREKSRAAVHGWSLPLLRGDALDLPFANDCFDAVVSGFLMRNVTDVTRAFAEQRRVVRPGGRVVCLEITRPQKRPASWLFWAYFGSLAPVAGSLLSGHLAAYTYLPRSVARFVSADELQAAMERAGLSQVTYRLLMMHSVAVHVGVK